VFGRDRKTLVAISWSGSKHLLDVAPGLEPSQQLPSSAEGLIDLWAGPDGRTITTVHQLPKQDRPTVRLFDLSSGGPVGPPIAMDSPAKSGLICWPALSPDGRAVATGVEKNACQVWDSATGRERGPRMGMKASVQALAFSPDGQLLAGGDCE